MNSHHFHAVIWIDHHEARVFHFSPTDVERLVLHPDRPTKHIHHKANSIGSGHASEDHAFLQAVAQSIADAGAVLVTGPANAKTELVKHISQHDPRLMKLIVGVETVDHPSDAAARRPCQTLLQGRGSDAAAEELNALLGLVFDHHRRSVRS
jgi:stalled ribosome rescue protein Dom34